MYQENRNGAISGKPADAVKIRNLCKSYDGQMILDHCCLTLEPGGSYCLMGRSGIGKTTLLRILMGLETPDAGTVTGLSGLRISAVFQEDRLLEGYCAAENISFASGRKYTREQLGAYLLRLLPAEALNRPVSEFSGGMKRRTAILRALLTPSDILIMDEPFTGLDADIKKKTAALICELLHGRTLLAVSHHAEEAGLLAAEIIRL